MNPFYVTQAALHSGEVLVNSASPFWNSNRERMFVVFSLSFFSAFMFKFLNLMCFSFLSTARTLYIYMFICSNFKPHSFFNSFLTFSWHARKADVKVLCRLATSQKNPPNQILQGLWRFVFWVFTEVNQEYKTKDQQSYLSLLSLCCHWIVS